MNNNDNNNQINQSNYNKNIGNNPSSLNIPHSRNQNPVNKNIPDRLNRNNFNYSNRSFSTPKGIGTRQNNIPKSKNNNLNKKQNNNLGKNSSLDKIPNALSKTKKIANFVNKLNTPKNNNQSNDENNNQNSNDDLNNNNNNNDNDDNNSLVKQQVKSILVKKILPILIPAIAIFLAILAVISPIISAISSVASFFSLENHNSSNPSYIYTPEQQELLEAEKAYNQAILDAVSKYRDSHGVTIDKYLLHATLYYKHVSKSSNFYTDVNTESDDLNDLLENPDNNNNENSDNNNNENSETTDELNSSIKMIDVVALLMIEKSGEVYTTDFERDGSYFNNLLNSKFLESYYADYINTNNIDSRDELKKKLVNEIFDFADLAKEFLFEQNTHTVISGQSIVYLQTCYPTYNTKQINGISVYDNPLTNEGTDYPSYLNISDYLKGILMTEVGSYIKTEYKEGLKAMATAALTFLLNDKKSGFDLKTGEMYFPTGNCRQVACDPTNGCTYLTREGHSFGTAYVGLNRYGATTGQHKPLTEEKNQFLDEILSEIFGKVIVKKGVTPETFKGSSDVVNLHYYANLGYADCHPGYCMGQVEVMADAKNNSQSYEELLKKYYYNIDFDIINVKEGLYHESTGMYNGTINLNENYHYHQFDSPWKNQNLCDSGSISANGCNITTAATAISLLRNENITPKVLNDRQNDIKTCKNGARPQMIKEFVELYGLKATFINKNDKTSINDMLSKLASGNYVVIARMAPNNGRYSTEGGHYITLVGVKGENGTDKVLVWDPGSSKKSRDNYWADFNNDILTHTNSNPSFILVGRN